MDPKRSDIVRVSAVTLGLVAAATVVGVVIHRYTAGRAPFITFPPAVMLVAISGGLWAGIVATGLATVLAAVLFIEPIGSLGIAASGDVLAAILFLIVGIMISVVCERLRRAGHKIDQTQNLLQSLLDSAPAAVFLKDRHGVLRMANRGFAELAGHPIERIIGRREADFFPASNVQRFLNNDRKTLEAGTLMEFEEPVLTAQGERCYMTFKVPIVHAGEAMVCGFALDITDRKRTEQALRDSEERLRLAAQVAGFGTYDIDLVAGTCHWSDELKSLYGLRADEPAEFDEQYVPTFVHPDDRQRVARELAAACHPDHAGHFESDHRIVRRDGEVRWVLMRGRTLFQGSRGERRAMRATGMVLDVTERVLQAQELREMNRTLEERVAQRTAQLRRLAGEVAKADHDARRRVARTLHDGLQQVLVAARMRIDMLQHQLREPLTQDLNCARELLDESIQITRDVAVELNPPVLHEQGLTAALQWLGERFAQRHRLAVEVKAEASVSTVSPDTRSLLFEAAQELLLNTAKHGQTDHARISVTGDTQRLCLVVEDDGQGASSNGFDPQHLERCIGTGLRSLSQRLALIGGRIQVTTAPGQGYRVQLEAPVEPPTS